MADERVSTDIDAEKAALRRLVLARRDALDTNARAQRSARVCAALAREALGNGRSADNGDACRPTVAVYAAFGSEVDPSAFAHAAKLAGWRVAYPCMLPRESTGSGTVDAYGNGTRPHRSAATSDIRDNAVARDDAPFEHPTSAAADGTRGGYIAAAASQRMCMRAVTWGDRAAAPFLIHPTRPFAERDIDPERFPVVPARELDAIIVPLVAFDARGMRLGYGGGCYDRYLPTLSAACRILGITFAEQQVAHVPADEHDLPLPRIITA